jgi:long-chain acyl-CoA synthetase
MTETTPETATTQGTVATLAGTAGQRFAEHVAARYKSGGEWHELTFAHVKEAVDEIALGLVALGIAAGDRVAILADTRLEWTLASYAISAAGAVVVPVYPTNSPKECAWVLGNSGARAVFCESEAQRAKIDQVRDELPDLKATIGIEKDAGESSVEQLRERGRDGDRSELEARQAAVAREDPYTIIYTSGTTGPPKGVVLTHGNAMSVGEMVQELDFISPGERTYLFLPLAHAFALTAQLASFELGTTIIFYGGDSKKIREELVETSPTYLPSVPRIFEKLYTAAMKLQEQGDEQERARYAQAIELGVEVRRRQQHGESVPDEMQAAFD